MVDINPRSFGELFNDWFRILGRCWKPLLLTSLVPFAIVGVIVAISFGFSDFGEFFKLTISDPEELDLLTSDEWIEIMVKFGIAFSIWIMATWVASAYVNLTATSIVVHDIAGLPTTAGDAHQAARSNLLRVLGVQALVGLAFVLVFGLTTGAAVLAIWATDAAAVSIFLILGLMGGATVAAVWLGVSVAFATPSILIENQGIVSSLRRSHELTKQNWWRTFGFLMVIGLIAGAAGQILGIVLIPLFLLALVVPFIFALTYGLSAVLSGPTLAAMATGYTIWYVDLRSRKEILNAEDLIAEA